ncbi:alpha/beta fold hydrolase [Ideonella sp. DXS22W]|uniref:Alpha/beta fold hydrolase n=1 Tax=Pseudaquabacterium inlustre TaxID=2984192 RepID=A0ABU9CPZ3_9BURK
MTHPLRWLLHTALACITCWALPAEAQTAASALPNLKQASYTLRDFRFNDGQVLPELRLHVTTLGNPAGEPVMLLHGTTGNGLALAQAASFGGELFGPGQPLDAQRYFIILPDAIGHGRSSKPSDGMRAAFPRYNYEDMVRAHHRLLTEHLGIKHLRLVLGNSMGGMHVWLFAQQHPGFADIAVPMAAQPVAMSGRNWAMRRLIVDSIRNDPAWQGGQYTQQPASARIASVFYNLATNGGHQALYRQAPTRAAADALLDQRLAAPFTADANDVLYQWDSSRDYDASAGLEKVRGTLLAINSADDERNPPELGVMEPALARIPGARLLLIPGSPQTAGHGTTGQARFWKAEVARLLQDAPRLAP